MKTNTRRNNWSMLFLLIQKWVTECNLFDVRFYFLLSTSAYSMLSCLLLLYEITENKCFFFCVIILGASSEGSDMCIWLTFIFHFLKQHYFASHFKYLQYYLALGHYWESNTRNVRMVCTDNKNFEIVDRYYIVDILMLHFKHQETL